MATQKQINANQQNSQKSTGPRTAQGKAAVSQNAVKHGLFASEAVIKGENQAEFDLYRDEMLGELAPAGAVESMLAERFVSLSWRLRRLERMQNQAIDVLIERVISSPLTKLTRLLPNNQGQLPGDQSASDSDLILGRAVIKDCSGSRTLDRLLLYERRIENSMFKTMRELEKLRLIRQMEQKASEEQSAPAIHRVCGFEAATQKTEKKVNLKKQSQSPAFGRKLEALNAKSETIMQNKANFIVQRSEFSGQRQDEEKKLKKQSQSAPDLMGVNSLVGKGYENKCRPGLRENKAKQSQTEPISGLGVVSREESAA